MSGSGRGNGGGNIDSTASMAEVEPGTAGIRGAVYERPGRECAATLRSAFGAPIPASSAPSNEDHYLVVRRYRGREVLATSLPIEILEKPDDQAHTFAVADGMGGRASARSPASSPS